MSQITRIQDESTPPPLPSLSPSSGCSSSNSIQANSSSSSSSAPGDHRLQQQQQSPSLDDSSSKETPPPALQTHSVRAGEAADPMARGADIVYSSVGTSGRMDGLSDSRRVILIPVPEEGLHLDDSASSSYYACIGSLFNQPAIHHPHHPSVQIPVNPSCSPAAAAASTPSPHMNADRREMITIHAQSNQGVGMGSYHIKQQDDGHKKDSGSQSPPPSSSSSPPKSPTVCLINSQSLATDEGQVNPAFKSDDADSSESNNNKNDLIEELESIQIVDQSTGKSKHPVCETDGNPIPYTISSPSLCSAC